MDMLVVTVVAKFGSLPNAVASSFKVSNVEGALAIKAANWVVTYDCVAKLWLLNVINVCKIAGVTV